MGNLLIVLVIAFAISFVLIYFVSSHDRKLKAKIAFRRSQNGDGAVAPDFRLFTKFCTDLCEYLKLEITDMQRPADDEIVIHAVNINPITRVEYLIVGFLCNEGSEIEPGKITEISDQIVSERLSKAIIVSPGIFPENVKGMPELAPMEFIDGAKIKELRGKMVL